MSRTFAGAVAVQSTQLALGSGLAYQLPPFSSFLAWSLAKPLAKGTGTPLL